MPMTDAELADADVDSVLKSEMPKEAKEFLGRHLQTPEVSPPCSGPDTLNQWQTNRTHCRA